MRYQVTPKSDDIWPAVLHAAHLTRGWGSLKCAAIMLQLKLFSGLEMEVSDSGPLKGEVT